MRYCAKRPLAVTFRSAEGAIDQFARFENLAARAAIEPLILPEMMLAARHLMGGVLGVAERIDKRTGEVEILAADDTVHVAETRSDYENYFSRINPRNALVRDYPAGFVHTDDLLGDDKALDGDEFYVDFLARNGLGYFTGAVVVDDDEQMILASVQRGTGQGRPGEVDKRLFARMIPIFGTVLAWHSRVRRLPQAPYLAELLDGVAEPAAILASDGTVHFANRRMQAMFEKGGLLRLSSGKFDPVPEALRRAFAKLLCAIERGRAAVCEPVAMPGRMRPLMLRAVRLGGDQLDGLAADKCLIGLFVDDPERPLDADIRQISLLFGLTQREAQVGAHFAAGWTIGETATKLGISRNTVRTHAAHLREKLGEKSLLGVAARLRSATGLPH